MYKKCVVRLSEDERHVCQDVVNSTALSSVKPQ